MLIFFIDHHFQNCKRSMLTKKLYKLLLILQGFYTLLTALWALIDIDSFMEITGPKTDLWLVKTVSVLLVPIAFSLILPVFFKATFWQPFIIGLLSAAGLAVIDFYYSLNSTISKIYLWDGIAQCFFALWWIYLAMIYKK